ncbi:MAG: Glycosyltransferase, group 2 family protein [candidate division WS6 bacterium 34_10]|uniref:Glycosyltransferase, group 2 family protein n=1 Tax=candidate division WS6 bacterium 34_10 TaxID=1641389 RepID=A0A101HH17_9BACT|nr:MAG: Glycosyltransferase, group 2 family protein [candidate division WS6 bacterium 34_10]
MKISLVLPTYKKEREVIEQLERLYSYLSRKNSDFELIFVVDGYIDNTKNILDQYIRENRLRKAKVVGYSENMGKGYAIRYGMQLATGDVIGFIDADTDIYLRTLGHAINSIKQDDVLAVVPSKFHKDSNVEMSLQRKVLSKLLIDLNKLFLRLPKGINDVGCGLKLFKKELIDRVLPVLSVDRFAIDSDLLNEIGKLNVSVEIIPFFLSKNRSDSTSTNIKAELGMVKDILRLSLRDNYFLTVRFFKFLGIKN